jgi:hypothetical protein
VARLGARLPHSLCCSDMLLSDSASQAVMRVYSRLLLRVPAGAPVTHVCRAVAPTAAGDSVSLPLAVLGIAPPPATQNWNWLSSACPSSSR